MVTVGFNPSTLKVQFKNGKVCIGCCDGTWDACYLHYPDTITVRISGITVYTDWPYAGLCRALSSLGTPNGDVVLGISELGYSGTINGWTVVIRMYCNEETGKLEANLGQDGIYIYAYPGLQMGVETAACFRAQVGEIPGTINNDLPDLGGSCTSFTWDYAPNPDCRQCGHGGSVQYLSATYPEE